MKTIITPISPKEIWTRAKKKKNVTWRDFVVHNKKTVKKENISENIKTILYER